MSLERESSAPTRAALKRTALNGLHKSLGAKMVEFGGWEMPVEYSGIIQEHLAVRNAAGLFDVSHMGEIEISGPRALALLQHVTSQRRIPPEGFSGPIQRSDASQGKRRR